MYTLNSDRVLMLLRYSRYMFFVKTNCGDEAEMMFEEILKHGYETASQVIITTYKKLKSRPPERQSTVPVLKEKFELLVQNQFLMRSIASDKRSEDGPPDFNLPNLNLKALIQVTQNLLGNPGDNNIYWRVNFDRLTQDFRDQLIISSISKRIDDNAGELMRRMLYQMYLRTASWSDTSNPIPFTELREVVRRLDNPGPGLVQYLEQYLNLIEEDPSKFIRRVGDSNGGQFSINMKEAFNQLAWTTLENIVMEKFGSKAARIFRLIRAKKYIEQEDIQQVAMISAKDTKQLTYTLLQENYIQLEEVKKAGVSAAPLKTFFLFHIDLDKVVRMEIEHCYQALYNTMQKREHETVTNKRLIDKDLRIQVITKKLQDMEGFEDRLREVDELMTEAEKIQLPKVQNMIKQLGVSELQIDDTLFLLTIYLRYNQKSK
ncbi:DNA-directed RNA polymerase III subunit RPC3 isoform X2 [Belonocnema kinseyi]|nr:DNA-directed RNA polymerase III subunit RPC3 isoform X2 [Belonocnema kinseyi]